MCELGTLPLSQSLQMVMSPFLLLPRSSVLQPMHALQRTGTYHFITYLKSSPPRKS